MKIQFCFLKIFLISCFFVLWYFVNIVRCYFLGALKTLWWFNCGIKYQLLIDFIYILIFYNLRWLLTYVAQLRRNPVCCVVQISIGQFWKGNDLLKKWILDGSYHPDWLFWFSAIFHFKQKTLEVNQTLNWVLNLVFC